MIRGERVTVTVFVYYVCSKDTDSSAVEEEGDSSDYKAWEVKFRCTNLKTFKKHSVGKLLMIVLNEPTDHKRAPWISRFKLRFISRLHHVQFRH